MDKIHISKKKRKRDILQEKVPKQIISLLLKEELSPTDLAEKIYGNKNARSGILKWIKILYDKKMIMRTDLSRITSRKKLFKAKLNIIANFDREEEKFVNLFIARFWHPIKSNPLNSIKELLLESIVIKKIYNLKRNLGGYDPENDLKNYSNKKDKFWSDEDYRDEFLSSVALKGENEFNKKISRNKKTTPIHIRYDFILMSLLIPDSIKNKLSGEHNTIGNPLFTAIALLEG